MSRAHIRLATVVLASALAVTTASALTTVSAAPRPYAPNSGRHPRKRFVRSPSRARSTSVTWAATAPTPAVRSARGWSTAPTR